VRSPKHDTALGAFDVIVITLTIKRDRLRISRPGARAASNPSPRGAKSRSGGAISPVPDGATIRSTMNNAIGRLPSRCRPNSNPQHLI
jgi:hypothetical protein